MNCSLYSSDDCGYKNVLATKNTKIMVTNSNDDDCNCVAL